MIDTDRLATWTSWIESPIEYNMDIELRKYCVLHGIVIIYMYKNKHNHNLFDWLFSIERETIFFKLDSTQDKLLDLQSHIKRLIENR
jgi:hypothetical protein